MGEARPTSRLALLPICLFSTQSTHLAPTAPHLKTALPPAHHPSPTASRPRPLFSARRPHLALPLVPLLVEDAHLPRTSSQALAPTNVAARTKAKRPRRPASPISRPARACWEICGIASPRVRANKV